MSRGSERDQGGNLPSVAQADLRVPGQEKRMTPSFRGPSAARVQASWGKAGWQPQTAEPGVLPVPGAAAAVVPQHSALGSWRGEAGEAQASVGALFPAGSGLTPASPRHLSGEVGVGGWAWGPLN